MTTKNAAEFWRRWAPWRHGDPGQGNFTDVMQVLGLYRQFATFVANHAHVTGAVNVLDLGCGAAQLSGPLTKAFEARGVQLLRYVGLDFADPDWMPGRVEREFAREGLKERGHYVHHDLDNPLPHLGFGPEPLVITSCWCMTYLGATRVATLLAELTAFVAHRSEPTRVLLNMLTAGRFDRNVLTRRFLLEVVPRQLKLAAMGRDLEPARALRLSMKALPRMRVFGDELAEYVTLMTVPELLEVVEKAGCIVESVETSALWGQTTSVAIQLPRRVNVE
ncbi:MAG TPA: class I SAM-dependent methyltransferase [Polyangium sp.]|nr:class I SAM-dependent methyltransferase [Polyangium sp.]